MSLLPRRRALAAPGGKGRVSWSGRGRRRPWRRRRRAPQREGRAGGGRGLGARRGGRRRGRRLLALSLRSFSSCSYSSLPNTRPFFFSPIKCDLEDHLLNAGQCFPNEAWFEGKERRTGQAGGGSALGEAWPSARTSPPVREDSCSFL